MKDEMTIQNEIKKKTKENTQLIVDLNAIKFEEKKQSIVYNKKRDDLVSLKS